LLPIGLFLTPCASLVGGLVSVAVPGAPGTLAKPATPLIPPRPSMNSWTPVAARSVFFPSHFVFLPTKAFSVLFALPMDSGGDPEKPSDPKKSCTLITSFLLSFPLPLVPILTFGDYVLGWSSKRLLLALPPCLNVFSDNYGPRVMLIPTNRPPLLSFKISCFNLFLILDFFVHLLSAWCILPIDVYAFFFS